MGLGGQQQYANAEEFKNANRSWFLDDTNTDEDQKKRIREGVKVSGLDFKARSDSITKTYNDMKRTEDAQAKTAQEQQDLSDQIAKGPDAAPPAPTMESGSTGDSENARLRKLENLRRGIATTIKTSPKGITSAPKLQTQMAYATGTKPKLGM